MNNFDPDDQSLTPITTAGGWAHPDLFHPHNPSSTTAALQQPSPQAAREFLHWLGGDYLLCCIHPDRKDIKFFRCAAALRDAFRLNARGYNVYYVVNEVKQGIVTKPDKTEIEFIRAIYGDIDWDNVKFKGHFQAGLAELRITVELLKSMEPPPSMIVFTGGGLHPIWRIETLSNTPENMQHVETLSKYIEDRFNGDPVGEISRILRLPGTVNHPKKEKRDKGQTKAVATVLYGNGNVYKIEELEAAWPDAKQNHTPKKRLPTARAYTGPPLEETNLAADDDYDDLGAGCAEIKVEELRYYGLIVASVPNGPFSSRKKWTSPATNDPTEFSWLDWLFVASDLADEYPEKEAEIKMVFDEVCDRAGGDTSGNDKQWDWAVGQSAKRRLAGEAVTTMGTLIHIARIVETFSPQPSIHSPLQAATTNSQPSKPVEEPPSKPAPAEPAPDSSGFSAVLTPHRQFGNPQPILSVFTVANIDATLPPRPWAYGNIALYGAVTMIAAPGGSGKTALAIVVMLAGASGHALLGHKVFLKAQKVLFVTQEEPKHEIERRLAAAMRHYQIAEPYFGNILFRAFDASKEENYDPDQRIELVSMKDGIAVVNKDGVNKLENLVNDFNPRIVILDPLNSLLAAGLSDNLVLTQLILRLNALRTREPVAIIIMHHTRKGADLMSAEAAMGAYGISNTGRMTLNLQTLTGEEAKQLGILPSRASSFFRTINAKANYSERLEDEDIYQHISINLGNDTPDYPSGDNVGVVVKFDPASVQQTRSNPQHDLIALKLIHQRPATDLLGLSKTGAANERNVHKHLRKALYSAGIVINRKNLDLEIEQTVDGLQQRGLVEQAQFKDADSRKRKGLKLTGAGIKLLTRDADSGEKAV